MKLSVIVPVYNVEKFLPRCLDSLLRQGMEVGEYEVICVNDGSPDNSAQILANYQAKHPGIFRVVTQGNQGLGGARNTGTALARGEYVAYVDSDDYLMDKGYRYLFDHFCKDEVDVVVFEKYYVYTDGIERKYAEIELEGKIVFEGDGAELHNQLEMASVYQKVYRRSFLQKHNLLFTTVYLEDLLYTFQMCQCNPYLIYIDTKIHGYEKNHSGSAMHLVNKQRVLAHLDSLLYGLEYMNGYLKEGKTQMVSAAHRNINTYVDHIYKQMFRVHLTWREWRMVTGRLKKQRYHQPAYGVGKKEKVLAMLKTFSGNSYIAYLFIGWLYKRYIYQQGNEL